MCGSSKQEFPAIPAPPPPPAPPPIPGARKVRAPEGQRQSQKAARSGGASRLRIPLNNVNIPK